MRLVIDESKINTNAPKGSPRASTWCAVDKSFQKWPIIHYCNPNIAQFTSIYINLHQFTLILCTEKQLILIMRLFITPMAKDGLKSWNWRVEM